MTRINNPAVVKGHVIGNLGGTATQITVILQVTHNRTGNDLLRLVQLQLTQLIGKMLLHGLFAHRGRGIIFIVTAAVVGKEAVPRYRVVVTVGLGIIFRVGRAAILALGLLVGVLVAILVILVGFLLECLNLIHLVVDEFRHLGIVLFKHHAQQALLFQRQPLRLFLLQSEFLFCHRRQRLWVALTHKIIKK